MKRIEYINNNDEGICKMKEYYENRKSYYENKDYSFWRLLVQTKNAIQKARKKELRKYNIRPRQAVILALAYGTEGAVTPSMIAQWGVLEVHSVSEAVNRMQQEGLVRKRKTPGNDRSVNIEITEKGYKLYCQAAKQESIHKIFSHITESERQQLRPILRRLRDVALKEIGQNRELPFPPY